MSLEVALIDFPRLQEQIASRLLSEHHARTEGLNHNEASARLSMFNLALFFWPENSTDAAARLGKVRQAAKDHNIPVVIVASDLGMRGVQAALHKEESPPPTLTTPLQPQLVARKLAEILGNKKEVAPASMNADYINPFIQATLDTLKQMADMDCERTGLEMRIDGSSQGYISGVMGLSGAAEGFVAITFSNELARKIVCRMLQMSEGEETESDIRDGVGEMMNIIAGAAKADLVHTEHSFQLSLPNVIVGGPHSVGQIRGVPVMAIEFTTSESEKFMVMVSLVPRPKKQ